MPLVTFLGTGAAGGAPYRARSCIMIESRGTRVILDFGDGCSQRLLQLGMTLRDVDAVYISHLHPDHYAGLFDAAVAAMQQGHRGLTILAAEEVYSSIDTVLNTLPMSYRPSVKTVRVPLQGLEIGDLKITPVEARHTIPTYGALVEAEGTRILYTSDTAPNPRIEELARTTDLVIHEATLPSNMEDQAETLGHTTTKQVLELHYKTLVITHMSIISELDIRVLLQENRDVKDQKMRVIIASDLMNIFI